MASVINVSIGQDINNVENLIEKNLLETPLSLKPQQEMPRIKKTKNLKESKEKNDLEIYKRVEEVLTKEKEIEVREKKIEEIEEKIEQKLSEISKNPSSKGFFTKDLIQGFFIGFLVMLIGFIVYIKVYI